MNQDLAVAGGVGGAGLAGGLYMGYKMGSGRAGRTLRKSAEITAKAGRKHGRMAGRRMFAGKGLMGATAGLSMAAAYQHYGQGDTLGTMAYGAAAGGTAALGVKSLLSGGRHRAASRSMHARAADMGRAAGMADDAVRSGAKAMSNIAIEEARRGARVSRAIPRAGRALSRVL